MVSCIVQSIAIMMGCAATLLTFAIFGMPHWRMSVIVEGNANGRRLDGYWIGRWDGLWVTCVRQSGNPMVCQSYSQTIMMSPDLKIARILMSFAIMSAIGGCACSFIGMLYDKCCPSNNKRNRRCFLLMAGISFIMAGLLVFLPAIYTAITTLKSICYSNCKNVQHQEIGEAIMLAWPTVMLFLIGGSIFCWYHPCICSEKKCICPCEEIQPDLCPDSDNDQTVELTVFHQTRRQNQDVVI